MRRVDVLEQRPAVVQRLLGDVPAPIAFVLGPGQYPHADQLVDALTSDPELPHRLGDGDVPGRNAHDSSTR